MIKLSQEDLDYISEAVKEGAQSGSLNSETDEPIYWAIEFWKGHK